MRWKKTRQLNLARGKASGFPPCCVYWFSYVWMPLITGIIRRMYAGYWSPEPRLMKWIFAVVRGTMEPGYIECPSCRLMRLVRLPQTTRRKHTP